MKSYPIAAAGVLLAIAGLFGCVSYRPRPIEPPRLEQEFRSRTLDTQGPVDFETLLRSALRYSPEVRVALAQAAVAEARIVAAGARPNPSAQVEGGYNRNPESAALLTIAPNFTIETAGKRRYRILQAQRLAEAARLAVDEARWQARSRLRSALTAHLFALRRRDLLVREAALHAEIVGIFDQRLKVGEASRPELDLFRVNQVTAQAALQAAAGDVDRSLAALAGAAGVPVAALNGVSLQWPQLDSPPPEVALPLQQVQRAGLLHRIDVRRWLTEYAAADALLRLEVARQYPDLQIGPGYTFEEGFSRFTFAGSLAPLPVFHRNRGLIGVAEAGRAGVQAQVEAAQAAAIAEIETALARYRAATLELRDAAQRLAAIERDREAAALKALQAGFGDRLALALARLESAAAARARLDALVRAQSALGALEDAVQQPLEAPTGGRASVRAALQCRPPPDLP